MSVTDTWRPKWYTTRGIVLCMVWYGMVEVCEGAPVAVSGWVLTDGHDLAPWYGMVWYGRCL